MWMGKIGNKSAAFINHKHFHPGSVKNMERVWLAEQKHKEVLKRQKELKEKRAEEVKIAAIRRQIREQEQLKNKEYLHAQRTSGNDEPKDTAKLIETSQGGLILTRQLPQKDECTSIQKPKIKSQYREDVYECGHSSIYGSYYDTESKAWGYKCCMQLQRRSTCGKRIQNSSTKRKRLYADSDISSSDKRRAYDSAASDALV